MCLFYLFCILRQYVRFVPILDLEYKMIYINDKKKIKKSENDIKHRKRVI